MAVADQSPRSWAYLADDMLYEIFRRIPCEVDRLHAGRACHFWRVALAELNLPAPHPPLPWLLLPEDEEHGITFSCVLSERRTHPFFLPRGARRARYFGSYDGAWLFLAVKGQGDEAQDHVLVNLRNFQYLDLPNAIFLFNWCDPENIAIVAATLSRPPTEQGCIVAGIVQTFFSPHRIVFWDMSDRVVSETEQAEWPWSPEKVEDLLYHNGDFLFLIRGEHIRVRPVRTIFHEAGAQISMIQWTEWRFLPRQRGDHDDEQVLARYLVESRRRLLMVVRLTSGRRQNLPTSAFRVFQKEVFNDGDEEDQPFNNGAFQFQCYWSELTELDGRMLFVGRGCSRSYEAANGHPGMEGVYFLDDRSFDLPIVGDAPKLPYRCSDNGKWSKAPTPQVGRCFPERGPSKSKCSTPVWILP